MRWFAIANVYETVKPFGNLLKVCGLNYGDTWSQSPASSRILKLFMYIVLFVVIYSYITFVNVVVLRLDTFHDSLIIGHSENLYAVILFLIIVYSMVFGAVSRNKVSFTLRKLHEIDSDLLELNVNIDHQKQHFQLTVALISGLSVTVGLPAVTLFCYMLEGFEMTFYKFLSFVVLVGCYFLLVSQATLAAQLLKVRFGAINKIFRMYFPTTPTSSGFLSVHTETTVCNEKEQLAVLKQIKILHDKLNDVVELVNYCFSVQITFCVGLCFVIGVVCSFGLFRAFIYRNELFYMGVLNFIWYMYYLFFVLFFIAVGSKITRELNIFSQQLLHRSPVITCGLFVYDWTLLYTMIGATATYLIILIQFDVSFPNLVNVNGTTATGSAGS
ncbi:uncharacterized protein LOC131685071 isoform X3 [Topomyia yanbarensis]|uniref:uncharacterized protein LOC131685071 isoform X3 n=1 Tax=Topomyia yanbarensis TaxID=2498891 RepID=UPI00273B534C|nr:uncharacterized protein LOC131685071 isoform X3 [Topomyia yanbarensis]